MGHDFIAGADTFQHDGKTWTLSPVRLVELKELETYLRTEPISMIGAIDGLSPADRRYLLDKAYADIREIRIGTPAFDDASQTLSGVTHLLFLSIRQKHPDVSKGEVESLVTIDNLEEVQKKLIGLMGLSSDPTKAGKKKSPAR